MDGATATEVNDAASGQPDDLDIPQPRVPDFERIQNARNRRKLQIKEWQQYDRKMLRDSEKLQRKGLNSPAERGFFRGKQAVKFPQSLIFLEAAARGDLDEVRKLLSEGVCPDVANENGLTALHQCCIDNTREMCLLLLRFGANPNARDTEQWTPLHAAATCNHTDLCSILIAHNADLLAMNADGNMPYECCMPGPTLNLIETEMDKRGITQEQLDDLHRLPECQMLNDMVTLIKSGADPNALDSQGANWLHIAAACGYEDVTLFLIKNGAKVDVMDKDGWQAIHVAACWDHLEIIEILVNCGANLMAETTAGETVFDICEDLEMHARLNEIKEEVERRKTRQSTLSHSDRPRESVRRRSSTNPRSASIRRTSMREKKLISWKEAKQEAEMRGTSQLDVAESELPTTAVDLPQKPSDHPQSVIPVTTANHTDYKQSVASSSFPIHRVNSPPQNEDSIRSPKPRVSHPSASSNGSTRLPNGAQSSPPVSLGLHKPIEKTITKSFTEERPIEQFIRSGPEGDRSSGQQHRHSNSLSRSREHPVPQPLPRGTSRQSAAPEWHPLPNQSPMPKPRTISKERMVGPTGSGRGELMKNGDKISGPSPSANRRSDGSKRAPVSGLLENKEPERTELASPNISAHNAYYSPPAHLPDNHVAQTQAYRTGSVIHGTQSSLSRPKKSQTARSAKVVSSKQKSLIGAESEPPTSGKCCMIM